MPRKRNKENEGLPLRWRQTRGAYYYQPRPGERPFFDGKMTFRLGKKLHEAHAEFAKRLIAMNADGGESIRYVSEMLDKYAREVIPTKAPRTQIDNHAYIINLKKFFGNPPALITQIKTRHGYQYFNWRVSNGGGKRSARLEIALLSHAFTRAFRWNIPGLTEHPFIEKLRFEGDETSKARDRYVEDWELAEVLKLRSRRKKGSVKMIQAYIRIKVLTGLRRADMLRLRPAHDFTDAGIHVQPRKTAKTTGHKKIIEWSDELRAAVQDALEARPLDIAPWLFCDKDGGCYIDDEGLASGWDSMWQRFMDRVLEETEVKERFTEHDIRGKTGSDSASDQEAAKLLGHSNVQVTRKHYRRKGEKVRPLR